MWGIIQEGTMMEGEEEIDDKWKILSQDCPLTTLRVFPHVRACMCMDMRLDNINNCCYAK